MSATRPGRYHTSLVRLRCSDATEGGAGYKEFQIEAAFEGDYRVAFVFEGIGNDERIGNFGIIDGGAAGSEIDRADSSLGTPPHALVVARASDFSSTYNWMKEEMSHTHTAITGPALRATWCDGSSIQSHSDESSFAVGAMKAWRTGGIPG